MATPPTAEHRVLLGISGGIAAYKSCELIRLLSQRGCTIRVLMTRHAERFIGRLTLATLSGSPVLVDPLEEGVLSGAEHIDLTLWADLAIVAPATANILAKTAQGLADDFLSTTLCSFNKPRLFAPAMNTRMWNNPAVTRNVEQLRADGIRICDPEAGWLACGETGDGRMADPSRIAEQALSMLEGSEELAGKHILVTAGPTIEDIDDVRFLSNRSTGRMGFALARAAHLLGASVRLVAGPTELPTPLGVCRTNVRSAAQMADAVDQHLPEADALVMCAAVADYTPSYSPGKLKKQPGALDLRLERTRDVLSSLREAKGNKVFVGFALEMADALEYGKAKLQAKGLDLICVNDASREGRGFACDTNQLSLLFADGHRRDLDMGSKDEQARIVMRELSGLLAAASR